MTETRTALLDELSDELLAAHRAERYARGCDSAEGYHRHSFDHGALREQTVVPFRSSATAVQTVVDVPRRAGDLPARGAAAPRGDDRDRQCRPRASPPGIR